MRFFVMLRKREISSFVFLFLTLTSILKSSVQGSNNFDGGEKEYASINQLKEMYKRSTGERSLASWKERDSEDIIKWCQEALTQMISRIENIKEDIKTVPLKNREIALENDTKIQDVYVTSGAQIPVFDENLLRKYEIELDTIEANLAELDGGLNEAGDIIAKAINVNETKAWPDNLHMSSVVILSAQTEKFFVQHVNAYTIPSTDELIPFNDPFSHVILDTKTFSDMKIKQTFNLESLNGYPLSSYVTVNKDHIIKGHTIFEQLRTTEMKIGGLVDNTRIDNSSLLLKSGVQSFYGNLKCSDMTVSNLNTNYINRANLRDIMKDSAVINSSINLNGDLTIRGDLIYDGNLQPQTVFGASFKAYAEDVLLLHSPERQIIRGNYNLKLSKMPSLSLSSLNSVSFQDSSVFVNQPIKVYNVPQAMFNTINAKNVVVDESLNEIKVIEKEFDLVTLSGDHVVTGEKSFKKIHLKKTNFFNLTSHITRSLKKEVEIIKRSYKSSRKARKTLLTELKSVQNLRILRTTLIRTGNLILHSLKSNYLNNDEDYKAMNVSFDAVTSDLNLMNNLNSNHENVSEDFLLLLDHKLNVFSKLLASVTIPQNMVDIVNNFYLQIQNVLPIIETIIDAKKTVAATLLEHIYELRRENRRDQISHFKMLRSPIATGSHVTGLVSGFDFKNIPSNKIPSRVHSWDEILRKLSKADLVEFRKGLRTSSINSMNVSRLLYETVPLSASYINADLSFQDDVSVQQDAFLPNVNEVPTSNLARINGTNVFAKEIQFMDIELVGDARIERNLNDFDLKKLSEVSTVCGDQSFRKPVTFSSVRADSFSGSNVFLNDVPLEEFVLKRKGETIITGRKTFKSIRVSDPITSIQHLETDKLDGIKVSEMNRNIKLWKGDFKAGKETKLKSLIVEGDANTHYDIQTFDPIRPAINIASLLENALHANQNVSASGSLVLNGNIKAREIKFKGSFDGVTPEVFADGFVLNGKSQEIVGRNTFRNLRAKNVEIRNNLFQGVDLKRLNYSTAKIDEEVRFKLGVYFGDVASKKAINVSGLVQGWNLSRDALLASESATISGVKRFGNDVKVERNLGLRGFLNGIDFGKVCQSVIGEVKIKGPVDFTKDVLAEGISKGNVNFPSDVSSYWIRDRTTIFDSKFVFHNAEANKLFVTGQVNQEPIIDILEGRLGSECNERTIERKWLIDTVICDTLETDAIRTDLLDGHDSQLLGDIFVNGLDQTFIGPLAAQTAFIKELQLSGKLNGFGLQDFCLKGQNCLIESEKRITGDLKVIRDWQIQDNSWIESFTVGAIRQYPIVPVNVVVDGSLETSSLKLDGLIHSINFDEEHIMTLSKSQILNGKISISNPGQMALKATEARIQSQKINGMQVADLGSDQVETNGWESQKTEIDTLYDDYLYLTKHIVEAHSILKVGATRFEGWKSINVFTGFRSITPLEDNQDSSLLYIALISNEGVQLMNYVAFSKTYKLYAYIQLNCTTDAKGFRLGKELLMATSTNCPNPEINLEQVERISPENTALGENVYSYLWKITASGPRLYKVVATKGVSQILSFYVYESNCLVFISENSISQNILCDYSESLILRQRLKLGRIIKALHVDFKSALNKSLSLLVMGAKQDTKVSHVNILIFSPGKALFTSIQKIVAERLIWISTEIFNGEIYLATVQKPFPGSNKGLINIYRSHGNSEIINTDSNLKFIHQEKFSVQSPLEATLLRSSQHEMFLLVLTKNEVVLRYVKRGFGKFQLVGSISVPGAKSLISWIWNLENSRTLAVLGSGKSTNFELSLFKPLYN